MSKYLFEKRYLNIFFSVNSCCGAFSVVRSFPLKQKGSIMTNAMTEPMTATQV